MPDRPIKTETQNQHSPATVDPTAAPGTQAGTAEPPPPADTVTSPRQRKTLRKAFGDIIKALMPESVRKLAEEYGPAVFVGFCLGLIVGVIAAAGALKESEGLRALLLPSPSPTPASATAGQQPEKPQNLSFSLARPVPPFLQTYEQWGRTQGEHMNPANANKNLSPSAPPVGTVVSKLAKPTPEFSLICSATLSGSKIYANLVRQTTVNGREVFEQFESQPNESNSVIKFKVKECNAGDKLFMTMLILRSQALQTGDNFIGYFNCNVE